MALVLFAVLGWWVARQQAFNSVLPVPIFDSKISYLVDAFIFEALIVRNVGLGPAINVELTWVDGPDIGTFEVPLRTHVVALQAGGEEEFPVGGSGLPNLKNKTGEPPWREPQEMGTLTATYWDAHGRSGRLSCRVLLHIEERPDYGQPRIEVEYEVIETRLPEDGFRQLIKGRWLPDRH